MLRREPQFPERITPDHLEALRRYLRSLRPIAVRAPAIAPAATSGESISALDALLLQADLALRSGHNALARKLYTQADRDFPNSSAAATGLGMLAFGNGDRELASQQLHRAVEVNDRDALAWFELALLENKNELLETAIRLNPDFAQAHILVGVRTTDDGNLEAALQHLEKATRLMPRKSYAWYSLGYAQMKRGDTAAARESLDRALQTATTKEQHDMAATLLDSL
jgi:tetratricopeptide (TPR) repeat protein